MLLFIELLLTELLNIDGMELALTCYHRRFGELLTATKLFHGSCLVKFSFEFLQRSFDVVTFFNWNYDHCKYLFLVKGLIKIV